MKIFSLFPSRGMIAIFLLLSLSTEVSAMCISKEGMSKELSAYIATTESLLSRIKAEAGKTQCNTNPNGENSAKASMAQIWSVSVGATNEVIGFSNFSTSTEFFSRSLFSEVPNGIIRDHARLGKELENIKSTIDGVYGRCAGNSPAESILKEDTLYDIPGKSLGEVLKGMLQNQVNMMNFYRKTVLGDADSGESFKLVGDSAEFKKQLKANYGPAAFTKANNCEPGVSASIAQALQRIKDGGLGIDKGIAEWTKALKLLNGDKYEETERNLLRDELSKQGLSTKSSQAIMNNLEKYNTKDTHNGVAGFVKSIGERVSSSIDQFTAAFSGMTAYLKEMYNRPEKKVTTDEYIAKNWQFTTEKDIAQEIIQDYENAKSNIGPENQNTDEIVAKLMDIHINLESINKYMQPFIKVSQKVCNDQSTGNGNCQ